MQSSSNFREIFQALENVYSNLRKGVFSLEEALFEVTKAAQVYAQVEQFFSSPTLRVQKLEKDGKGVFQVKPYEN